MIENKAEKIDFVSPDVIVPWDKNANQHSEDQIKRLCKLIEHNGFRDPLIVSKRSGFLICGHGRLMAAKKLKLESVPVIYQDFRDEAEEYQFMVAHNAIASWSELDLSAVNTEMLDLGPDFDIDLLGIKDFVIEPSEIDLPDLSSGEPDCQQVTFVLSNEQKDLLDEALNKARKEEDCTDLINQNSNGNALAALLKRYVYG